MAAPYRRLCPAPLVGGQQQPSPRELQPTKKHRASLACRPCKEKRRKCSGERPECRECGRRLLKCIYEAAPGQTRMASLRENNKRMKTDLDTMMELYWYLQTEPKEKVDEILVAIQTGANPREVMETIKNRATSTDVTPSSSSASKDNTPTDPRPALEWASTSSSSRSSRSVPLASSCETQTSTGLSETQSPTGGDLAESSLSRTIESLGRGSQAFFSCTGCIFHIYDQDDTQRMLNDLRPYLENAGKSWLELVFQGSIPSHLKPSLCSLCVMAAVGLQYTKNPIPALGLESSGSDGTYEYVSVFYESARHLLEAVIEIDLMEAIKVCAALCVFNTIGHATIAMAYVDMGINFVLSLGTSIQHHPGSLSEVAWVKCKRVARTLVTLRSWLVSTLGYVHKNPGLQSGIHWLVDNKDMTPNETIQQELNKVVQIEANLLRTIDSFQNISPALLNSTRRDLELWYEQLPAWMHLSALLEPTEPVKTVRRTVFLVHLFYLSATILLARLAHGGQRSSPPRYDIEEVRIAVGDGVKAARTAARILQLKMDEQAIFQRCWCCEFTAYMSCLTLLHSAAQMQLHDYPQNAWQKELSYAESCLNVLEYCAKVDKVADRFAEATRGYYSMLAAQIQPDDDVHIFDAPENIDYLFSVPSTSPSHLAQASRDLLKRLGCPFDSPSSLYNEGILKSGLGAYVTLPFNHSPPQDASPWSAVERVLSGMPTGQFMGSSQPHGWDVFLNLNTL